ncbi:MAG: glutamine-synthetase adenylyltransferase, partial [Rhodospirillales bacterium]|nr:glutamine-synthetase adenylyltransferase [Rhodospirillales bacterium]
AAAEPRRLLTAIFSQSPFLTDCVLKEPKLFAHLIQQGPDAIFKSLMEDLARRPEDEERTGIMRRLRLIRRRAAMIIALSDLTSRWNLDQVTGALSDLACGLLEAALTYLLLEGVARKQLQLTDPGRPLENCGYVGLGMGKLGARELNFSSDIDLIVLFDPTRLPVTERRGPDEMAQRITRDLVLLLSERTADGYGFRVDLRLRPDPGAMPLAVRINAALSYYESLGQNWERAAMIKARPVVGDLPMGWSFLGEIRPFTWRRSPDFLAIQDIHAIKRQIYAAKGGSVVAIEGHNVKLGRGGIREIEFYAQTQQLIWGGRLPHLRSNRTVDALTALAQEGLIEPQ